MEEKWKGVEALSERLELNFLRADGSISSNLLDAACLPIKVWDSLSSHPSASADADAAADGKSSTMLIQLFYNIRCLTPPPAEHEHHSYQPAMTEDSLWNALASMEHNSMAPQPMPPPYSPPKPYGYGHSMIAAGELTQLAFDVTDSYIDGFHAYHQTVQLDGPDDAIAPAAAPAAAPDRAAAPGDSTRQTDPRESDAQAIMIKEDSLLESPSSVTAALPEEPLPSSASAAPKTISSVVSGIISAACDAVTDPSLKIAAMAKKRKRRALLLRSSTSSSTPGAEDQEQHGDNHSESKRAKLSEIPVAAITLVESVRSRRPVGRRRITPTFMGPLEFKDQLMAFYHTLEAFRTC